MLVKLLFGALGRRNRASARNGDVSTGQTTDSPRFSASPDSLVVQGRSLLSKDDLAGARGVLEQALQLGAAEPEISILLATVYAQLGELAIAHSRLISALEANPGDPYVHNAFGNVLRMEGRFEEAVESYRRAIAVDPALASAISNCALCLQELGQYEAAREAFLQALRADPSDATIATNFVCLLFDIGEYDEATMLAESLHKTHQQLALPHAMRGMALLRRGRFAEGWPEYEWRDRNAGRFVASAPDVPEWDGKPMPKDTLVVCAEQGLGDQIMFASCLGDLRARVAHIVVECDPRLKQLFARSFPDIRFYVQRKRDGSPWIRDGIVPDAKTWIGSLPFHFRRSLNDFPRRRSYLVVDPARGSAWAERVQRLGTGLKVGISWRGGTPSTRRATRSIPLSEWGPILHQSGMHFVSLQYGQCSEEIEAFERAGGIHIEHWTEALSDYNETGALVSELDLVISVQTSVVHLAGALGTRAWVLVPRIAEWRYGEEGDGMCWYQSVRLFRQHGQYWSEVLRRMGAELASFSAGTPQAHI